MNFFKEHNIFVKILSLLIAIFLWSYVVLETNPPKTQKFGNVVVEPIGLELLEERGLVLVNTESPKVTISLTGTSRDMVHLSSSDIRAEVDFSNIYEAGVYYMQPTIQVPKSIETNSYQPRRLQYVVENIITKDVPVRVTTRNELPEDKMVDKLTPSQPTITVRGATSVVSSLEYALVTVDLDQVKEDTMQKCRVTLYSSQDALVDSTLVTPDQDSLDVSVTLSHIATVPLSVSLLSVPDLTRDMVQAEILPETVRVYGPQNEISRLTTLSLGSIDLKNITSDGQEVVLSIKLPSGIHLVKDEPESARVKIVMKTNIKRAMRLTDIVLTDQSSEVEKPQISLVSDSVSIEVQGKANIVAALTTADIHAEAVFDSSALGAGTHTVPIRITVDASGVSVVSTELTAQITISEQEETES